jgi:hypothetical protein
MAQTTYRSQVAVTLATRRRAYERICDFLSHLDALDLNLVSITRDGSNFIVITLSDPLPVSHVDHMGLTGPI